MLTVHKIHPQSEGEKINCGHFVDKGKGFQDADVRTFWCKIIGFFEFYGVSARTRERGQIFVILCGLPFWTAP